MANCPFLLGLGVEDRPVGLRDPVWSSYDEESPASSAARVLGPPRAPPAPPPGPRGPGGGNSKPDLDF